MADMLNGVANSFMSGGSLISPLLVQVLLWVIIAGFGAWFLNYWYKYRNVTIIFENIAGNEFVTFRKFRLVRTMTETKLLLQRMFQTGERIQPPKDIEYCVLKNGKRFLPLRKIGTSYYSMHVEHVPEDRYSLHYDDHDSQLFHMYLTKEMEEAHKKRQTLLQQYGPMIAFFMLLVCMFIMFLLISREFGSVADKLVSASNSVNHVVVTNATAVMPGG